MMRHVLFCVLLCLIAHQVSSSPPSRLPSSNNNQYSSVDTTSTTNDEKSSDTAPRLQSSSAVTFLYELYEHEIYNPSTDRWSSTRFTQSPITGGGGRDSTSLDPQSCTPPRNYLFNGEWKIDMAGETRDGFGWEYYVGKYDGLGRRRRRWVRELRRISSGSNVILNKSSGKKQKKKTIQQQKKAQVARSRDTSLFQTIQQQYNFKGFGWSFYKSLLFKRSFGAAIRLPLSSNLDFYDQHTAWPYISTSTYFGYPWIIATFFNASLPVEAIKYVVGGAVWKVQWSLAVFSASTRSIVEALVWILLSPWRLTVGAMQTITALVGTTDYEKQDKKIADSLISIIHENKETSASIDNTDIKMESFIELSNSTDMNAVNDVPVSANTVVESPRGGAAPKSSTRKKRLTLFGNEVPTFHRPFSIEYSSTIQQRVGVCVSWRVTKERGYEYRCNFFLTCLPTILFWQQLGEERNRKIREMQQLKAKVFGSGESKKNSVSASPKSIAKRSSKNSALSSFFSQHSGALGFSSGWPLPTDPFFSLNLMMSLSGFYYGWILKSIGSLFSVRESQPTPKSKPKKSSTPTIKAEKSEIKADIHDAIDDAITYSETIPRESEVSDSEQEKKKKAVECK
mmetsp:Transcript_6126/g.8933  ORF Transcript_6126/g.8933 Transcript_6126/m.8933 type:complete len:624 (-) Transcript_6126:890-2761(-)